MTRNLGFLCTKGQLIFPSAVNFLLSHKIVHVEYFVFMSSFLAIDFV